MTSPLQTVAFLGMSTIAVGSLAVIVGLVPRSRHLMVDVPEVPQDRSGPCPSCGDGSVTVPASGEPRWSSPCNGCGMRLVGVVDPTDTERVWLPVHSQVTG